MTKPFTMQNQDERTPPQWLVSAFLVLLGVAIIAAIPANASSARGAAEATKATQALGDRIVVRAKIHIRVLPAKPLGFGDLVLTNTVEPPIAFASDRVAPRVDDTGTRIAKRGIKIRAPPADVA